MIRPLLLLRANRRGAASDGRAPALASAELIAGLQVGVQRLRLLVYDAYLEGVSAGLQEKLSDEQLRQEAALRANAVPEVLGIALTQLCWPKWAEETVALHTLEPTESR